MDIETTERGDANADLGAQQFAWADWFLAAALVAAVFLVCAPCWNGGYLWDDDSHLLNNPVLKPGGLAKVWVPGGYINYWPLTFTAYWLQFQVWGLKPLGFHLVNLALHALSALLVWRVLLRLRVPGAMFAAALFALHPVNVEAAAWISHLKDILSLALALVSMMFYLDSERHGGRWRYAAAIVAFLLSALAKGAAVTLPVVLLACAWWQRGRIDRRDLLRVVPYLLIGAITAGIEVWAQHSVAGGFVVRSDGFFSRLAVAGCALWFYLGKLMLPIDLSPIYPRWTIDEYSVLSYLPGVMWLAALATAWWNRGSWGRPAVMLIVCYSALLLPVLGFVNIYFMRFSLVADQWQYLATVVPFAVLAGMATELARRRMPQTVAISAAVLLLLVPAALSLRQSRIYKNGETFYEAILAQNPDCWLAENNLGVILGENGQTDAAIDHYHKALAIRSDYAEAHNNLGNALRARGQVNVAIEHFHRALEIKPDYAEAHNNLGLAMAARGQIDVAIAHYQRALAINPDYAEVHYNLAGALIVRGQIDLAIEQYKRALEFNPDLVEAHNNLATILAGRGDFDSAIEHYQRAVEIAPDNAMARRNLADVLAERERLRKGQPFKAK